MPIYLFNTSQEADAKERQTSKYPLTLRTESLLSNSTYTYFSKPHKSPDMEPFVDEKTENPRV